MKPLTGLESEILAQRWGVDQRAVLKWMKAKGFKSAMDLRVFSADHSTAMKKALADFWEWAT
jgi:hypothetical protein